MKKLTAAVLILSTVMAGYAQTGKQPSSPVKKIAGNKIEHKIVFQLTTDDTLAHKTLLKQLNNILTVSPDTEIEVVCHGPGLSMLVTAKTVVQDKIQQMKKKGVEFAACEFSMNERNVSRDKIIPEAGFVKAGIIEIVSKQEKGWSYIKSGF